MKKLLLTICCVFFASTMVLADPLPGQTLKFQQLPMDGTIIDGIPYWGHDELSTAVNFNPGIPGDTGPGFYEGFFMADDFADPFSTPVVHVKWWGSYLNQDPGTNEPPSGGIRKFLISFESDVPAGMPHPLDGSVANFSRPGLPLLNQIVTAGALSPASGTFTEKWISPGGAPLDESLYQYNAELSCEFNQEPDTVYWLKIVALWDVNPDGTGITPEWGWHNRDYTKMDPFASVGLPIPPGGEYVDGILPDGQAIWHFQDDAVEGQVLINDLAIPGEPCLVEVNQDVFGPTHYIDWVDGPGPITPGFEGIGQHSKDLAFELYTPEPATMMLLGLGSFGLLKRRRKG